MRGRNAFVGVKQIDGPLLRPADAKPGIWQRINWRFEHHGADIELFTRGIVVCALLYSGFGSIFDYGYRWQQFHGVGIVLAALAITLFRGRVLAASLIALLLVWSVSAAVIVDLYPATFYGDAGASEPAPDCGIDGCSAVVIEI